MKDEYDFSTAKANPHFIKAEDSYITKYTATVRFKAFPDMDFNLTKMPHWWFRFWTKVFLGAEYSFISNER